MTPQSGGLTGLVTGINGISGPVMKLRLEPSRRRASADFSYVDDLRTDHTGFYVEID
jgi:hypothetical protein